MVAGCRWQVTVAGGSGRWQVVGGRSYLAEMSRFTRFARHKLTATRHLKLFCIPDCRSEKPLLSSVKTPLHIRAFEDMFDNVIMI